MAGQKRLHYGKCVYGKHPDKWQKNYDGTSNHKLKAQCKHSLYHTQTKMELARGRQSQTQMKSTDYSLKETHKS